MPLIVNEQHTDKPLIFGGRPIDVCGVRLHGGNTEDNTEGCPLMGKERTKTGIKNCAAVFEPFLERLISSVKTNKVFIEIGIINNKGLFEIPYGK
jgi:hypothetical protein